MNLASWCTPNKAKRIIAMSMYRNLNSKLRFWILFLKSDFAFQMCKTTATARMPMLFIAVSLRAVEPGVNSFKQ